VARLAQWLVALAAVSLAAQAAGCATDSPATLARTSHSGEVPKQLVARQVVVTLVPAGPGQWARIATELGTVHGLPQVGGFPLTSIGVQCIVFQVPEDRVIEQVVERLAADPRVESVQANQMFRSLAEGPNDPYASFQ